MDRAVQNPVLALHAAGGGHNDAWLGALVLAALALAASNRRWLAGAAWALAVLVKWVPLVFLVLRALEAPIRQIAENAGVEGSIVVGKITDNAQSETFGFDAQTEEFVDLVQAGIVDPAKVVRTALQDAASVAGLLVTTEAMVAELPKKEAAPAMPGGGMGGMGGMDF